MFKLLKALTLAALFHMSLDHHHHVHTEEEREYVHVSAKISIAR